LDFDPSGEGVLGQVFFRPHDDNPIDKPITISFEDWMEQLCERLDNGLFEVDEGEIVFNEFTFQDET
jgi:hypothetical protein